MKLQFFIIYLINITLCMSLRYECDKEDISCGCGFKNVEINEQNNSTEDAIPYSWSMMVSIRYDCYQNGDPFTHCCSGTILSDRYILTGAGCFNSEDNSSLISGNITVAAGIHDLSQNCQTIRVVDKLFIHPNWTQSDEAMHNIAILRLAEPIDFKSDFIARKACSTFRMNTSEEIKDNTNLVVVGWNVLNNLNNSLNQILQQMSVYPNDFNNSICARSADDNKIFICAGNHGGLSNFFFCFI